MSDNESDIDREVDEIISKMDRKKKKPNDEQEDEEKPKRKRKPRGPASEKQKKALEEGRRRRTQDIEIKRLERDKKRHEAEKKLARLKREKAAREEDEPEKGSGKEDKVALLERQIEEMKQQLGKSSQPIINVHAPSAPSPSIAVNDPNKDAYERQLRRYCKV